MGSSGTEGKGSSAPSPNRKVLWCMASQSTFSSSRSIWPFLGETNRGLGESWGPGRKLKLDNYPPK